MEDMRSIDALTCLANFTELRTLTYILLLTFDFPMGKGVIQ